MGSVSEPDLERATGDGNEGNPDHVETVPFTTNSTAPPFYNLSAPLLIGHSPAPHPGDDINAEAQDIDKQKRRGWRPWLIVAGVAFPFLAVIFSMPVLMITRVDELNISVLAFILLLVYYAVTALCALSCSTDTLHPAHSPTSFISHYIVILNFWIFLAFSAQTKPAILPTPLASTKSEGIVYWELSERPDSLWAQFRNASALNEMLGVNNGMEKLVKYLCEVKAIQKVFGEEGRKASVADVAACLVNMGVDV